MCNLGRYPNQKPAFGLLPGGLYLFFEKFILRSNTTVMGARYFVPYTPTEYAADIIP